MRNARNILVLLLCSALIMVGWLYRDTLASIVGKWGSDASYSHGYLIVPIVVWLVWRQRAVLAAARLEPAWEGALLAVVCSLAWVVASGTGVLVVEQFAFVAMIPALVLAIAGRAVMRTLLFPLAFLFFAVPFGRALVPLLMQVTADIATLALQWSGVPVLRTHMQISIPGGDFAVARACSGLNYFTTSLVLGTLSAYMNYASWRKRVLCIIAFIVLPILLNGLRVYITILVSHLTDMRFGPGAEHITFGKIFYVVVILVLLWVARRWHDEVLPQETSPKSEHLNSEPTRTGWGTVVVAVAAVGVAPLFLRETIALAQSRVADTASLVVMPQAVADWQGPKDAVGRWRPRFTGGIVERQAVYRDPAGRPVDVFVAVYGLGVTNGAEMINYDNVIDPGEFDSLLLDRRVPVSLPDGRTLKVRELTVMEGGVWRLVWQWYLVGDQAAVSPFAVKGLEALAFATRSADSERIVAVSTPNDDDGQQRLYAFLKSYGSCAAMGFAPEACDE